MTLVIDIDEDVYTRLFDNGIQDNEIAVDDVCEMARALRLGTPLPEHHGRLISEEDMLSVILFSKLFDNAKVGEVKEVLLNIPTIIEGE